VESLYVSLVKKTPMLREEIISSMKIELAGNPRDRVVEATFKVAPQRLLPEGNNK
jgi:hypothetical protein